MISIYFRQAPDNLCALLGRQALPVLLQWATS
jgi:hypothetical protein